MAKVGRYIIALDSDGSVYVRKTVCVVYRGELEETHYHTKGVSLARAPAYVQEATEALRVGVKAALQERRDRASQGRVKRG